MPFRDNDEATRARAEALANEVEALRVERDALIAARDKKHEEERDTKRGKRSRKRAAAPDAAFSSKLGRGWDRLTGGWKFAVCVLLTVLLIGGVLGVQQRNAILIDRSGPGALLGAHLVRLPDGSRVLIAEESVFHGGGNGVHSGGNSARSRVDVIDLADGRRRARISSDAPYGLACIPAVAGLVWCGNESTEPSLEVRDAATLAVKVTHAQLVALAPPLSHEAPFVDHFTGEVWFFTMDGRYWHLDARTLRSGTEDKPPLEGHRGVRPDLPPLGGSIDSSAGNLYFEGAPRGVLRISDRMGDEGSIAPETSWLKGSFLIDTDGPSSAKPPPLVLEGGNVVLIVQDTSVEKKQVVLTAQGLDGKRRWSATLGHGSVIGAWLVGKLVVIAVSTEREGVVVALDAANGREVWRTAT